MNTQITLEEMRAIVADYIAASKIANNTYTPTYDNTAGLLDKIAKTYTIVGLFEDKLPELDGDFLDGAKTLEEYYANLVKPTDFDSEGSDALAPAPLTYMPACYSYTLGRKKFKVTKYYDDLERAFNDVSELGVALSLVTANLYHSYAQFKFMAKKELLAKYASAAIAAMTSAAAFAPSTNYKPGVYLKSNSVHGVVVKEIPATQSPALTWATAVGGGYIVVLDLVSTLPIPTDTATGEAFIKEVKKYGKLSKYATEGNSLSGNAVGASTGMLLIINDVKVMPSIEVDTWAGAFHKEDALFDIDVKGVNDFGNDSNNVYAIMIDRRGCKLHNSYIAVRTQENGSGDFLNYFLHTENTAAYSNFTFLHVFKSA